MAWRISFDIIVESRTDDSRTDHDLFYGFCPQLTGVESSAATVDEAFVNALDAAKAYLTSLIKRGDFRPPIIHTNLATSPWRR